MSLREKDPRFWEIVDNGGVKDPPELPEFDKGGNGHWPSWSTHLMAFLCGGIVFTALVFAPIAAPALLLVGLLGFVGVAVRRRWR
jgi:hypothetical protein